MFSPSLQLNCDISSKVDNKCLMTPKQVDGMERRATQHPLRSVTSEENSGPALGGSNLPYPAGLEQRRAKRERLADVQQIKGSCHMMFFDIFRWSISCFHLAVRSGLKPVSCGCGVPSESSCSIYKSKKSIFDAI